MQQQPKEKVSTWVRGGVDLAITITAKDATLYHALHHGSGESKGA